MGYSEEILADLLRRAEGRQPESTAARTEVAEYVKVSALDLRIAATSNPSHPLAEVFARSVEDHAETEVVAVNRIDLLALLKNRRVHNRLIGNGRYQKILGDEYPAGTPVTQPLESFREQPDEEPELGSTDGPEEDDETNV